MKRLLNLWGSAPKLHFFFYVELTSVLFSQDFLFNLFLSLVSLNAQRSQDLLLNIFPWNALSAELLVTHEQFRGSRRAGMSLNEMT